MTKALNNECREKSIIVEAGVPFSWLAAAQLDEDERWKRGELKRDIRSAPGTKRWIEHSQAAYRGLAAGATCKLRAVSGSLSRLGDAQETPAGLMGGIAAACMCREYMRLLVAGDASWARFCAAQRIERKTTR